MKLIGLMGAAGAGKSTVAEHLCDYYEYERLTFAGPIKIMLAAGFDLTEEQLYGTEKNTPLECFGGKSTREAMQTLGTEWGRGLWPDIWLYAMQQHLRDYPCERVVIEDVRFENEVSMIRNLGGSIWIIRRQSVEPIHNTHSSEAGWVATVRSGAYNMMLQNEGSIHNLTDKIDSISRVYL